MKKYILGLLIVLTHGITFCCLEEDRAHEDWLEREGYVRFSLACGTGGRCLLSEHKMAPSDDAGFNYYLNIPRALADNIKQRQLMYYHSVVQRQEEANKRMHDLFEQCCKLKELVGDNYEDSPEKEFVVVCHRKLLSFKAEVDKCHAFQIPLFFKVKMLVNKIQEDTDLYCGDTVMQVLASKYGEYFFRLKKYEERLKILKGLSSYLDDCEKEMSLFTNPVKLDTVCYDDQGIS